MITTTLSADLKFALTQNARDIGQRCLKESQSLFRTSHKCVRKFLLISQMIRMNNSQRLKLLRRIVQDSNIGADLKVELYEYLRIVGKTGGDTDEYN